MARFAAFLFLVVAVCLAHAYANADVNSHQCGPHEEFNSCGTYCEPSCDNPQGKVCVHMCRIGCQCKSGYVRNDRGDCVLLRSCA